MALDIRIMIELRWLCYQLLDLIIHKQDLSLA